MAKNLEKGMFTPAYMQLKSVHWTEENRLVGPQIQRWAVRTDIEEMGPENEKQRQRYTQIGRDDRKIDGDF